MKKLKIGKVYWVEWIDAGDVILRTSTGEKAMWISKETLETYNAGKLASIGYLVAESKDYILLAGSYDSETGDVSVVQMIPRGCVTDVERLYIKSYFKEKKK